MAAKKVDPDKADEQPVKEVAVNEPAARVSSNRVKGAYFLGGVWYSAGGSPLNDVEAQAAHRAMDKAAAEAREKALLGR